MPERKGDNMAAPRDQIVTFKVSNEELEMLKRGAEKEGMTQSEYCRACVIRDRFKDNDPIAIKIFKENVAMFVKAKGEALHELLDDFLNPLKGKRPRIKQEDPSGGSHKR